MVKEDLEYDVVLSFAGENRPYVEKVAEFLIKSGVKIFYDKYDEIDLWGKDLYIHLDEVYRLKAKYCVMFISEHYKRKLWTNHEMKSALARAFVENQEYILPARFDDTELPGIRPTLGYIDLINLSPEDFAIKILSKLGRYNESDKVEDIETFRIPKKAPKSFNPYNEANNFITLITEELNKRCKAIVEHGVTLSSFERQGRRCIRIVVDGITIYSLDITIGGVFGDSTISFYGIRGEMSNYSNSTNAWGKIVWDKDINYPVLELNDMSMFRFLSDTTRMTYEEFVNNLWDVVCNIVEEN